MSQFDESRYELRAGKDVGHDDEVSTVRSLTECVASWGGCAGFFVQAWRAKCRAGSAAV